ncbi:hypothetical protein ColLi_00166 [Colletotrichum liriopes]|uniref:Palmitoyltransferase n=1 Tax=Colletotrichum liriopes TaxID=708192 RepID=A0AA37GAL7_9PEZI|nr:hypothetical protein ColLi_00166 [Colletotrichum liriopes]
MDIVGFAQRLAGPGLNLLAFAKIYFFWSLPILLVGMFFLDTWVVVEVLYFRVIKSSSANHFVDWSSDDKTRAGVLLGVYVFLLVNTAGSISYCWLLAHFHAKSYKMPSPEFPVPRPRTVMQTTRAISEQSDFAALGVQGCRPNRCEHSCGNSSQWKGDRMYHCRFGYELCLPVFDHFCYWLWTPVYLHTIKPYSMFLPLLFLYSTYSLALMSWALCSPFIRGLSRWSYVVVALASLFTLVAAYKNVVFQWDMIVFKNRVGKERDQYLYNDERWIWRMAILHSNGSLVLDEPGYNPYSQGGKWANAQEVLGEWYQMPFWFWQPRRVGQYGCHWNLDNDTTISAGYMIHANGIRHRQMSALPLEVGVLSPSMSSLSASSSRASPPV